MNTFSRVVFFLLGELKKVATLRKQEFRTVITFGPVDDCECVFRFHIGSNNWGQYGVQHCDNDSE